MLLPCRALPMYPPLTPARWASMAITRDAEQDAHFDPSACVEVCRARYPNVRPAEIVAAVHGPRCGCHVGTLPETFSEVDSTYCTYQCKFYENPICGGPPSFWGVFVQYDFQAFSSHGAYDPWRKIWYTIAVVREATIIGAEAWNPDLQLDPERYYLHAASVQTGQAALEAQVQFSATETPKEHKLFGVLCKNTLGHFFWPASQRMRTVKIIRQCFSAAMTGIQCVVFDLDDTLWSTAATLEHAHEVMNNALQTELPEEPIESPEQFRDRMRAVQKDFPEREHDFGFCRREALMRMTGDAMLAERVFVAWHKARNEPTLFDGAEEMLRRLKRTMKIGTLTDGNADPFVISPLKDLIDFHVNSVEETGFGERTQKARRTHLTENTTEMPCNAIKHRGGRSKAGPADVQTLRGQIRLLAQSVGHGWRQRWERHSRRSGCRLAFHLGSPTEV
ncbi:unnamed protein product [Durusdinium trenchii]|uniref:Uncharacterized protein n=2 Tax=Durusdinium trenchii TaxID=1381693 RepID=A0ABP0S3E7_9DINO